MQSRVMLCDLEPVETSRHVQQEAYTDKFESRNWVLGTTAICVSGCGICRGDGGCALGVQIEHMHSAFVAGHSHKLWNVTTREGNAEYPCGVSPSPQLLWADAHFRMIRLC